MRKGKRTPLRNGETGFLLNFRSVHEMQQYANHQPNEHEENASRFTGLSVMQFDQYEHHAEAMRTGWTEGERFYSDERAAAKISSPAPTAETFESRYDLQGDSVDVGRFVEGAPECMLDYYETETTAPGQVLTIAFPGAFLGSVETSSAIRYGIALASIVDELEGQGYRVGIQYVATSGLNGTTSAKLKADAIAVVAPIKPPAEPLDISRLVRTCCNPDFFRRTVFAIRENVYHAETGGTYGVDYGGYGVSMDTTDGSPQALDADVYLAQIRNHTSVNEALRVITRQVEKQTGIKVNA